MPVFAFLKLIPTKDYIYGGVILALLIAFGVYTHHERQVGRDQIEAANDKVARAQEIHNDEVEFAAKAHTDAALAIYRSTLASSPSVDAPHVWVRDYEGGACSVRGDAASGPVADGGAIVSTAGTPDHESTVEHARDIGPSLDKLLEDADAQVVALQEYIHACQDEGVCTR
jgi:hypothetical protein